MSSSTSPTRARRVFVLSGDASKGVATQFVGDLDALRAECDA